VERTEIRSLIRSVLTEELGKHQAKTTPASVSTQEVVRQEKVRITNDQELAAFVKRIASASRQEQTRADMAAGRYAFMLDKGASQIQDGQRSPAESSRSDRIAGFDKGFINERQIDALNGDIEVVLINKAVRFTPLAIDKLRQRGIRIERKAS
jgi:hypothetical protein